MQQLPHPPPPPPPPPQPQHHQLHMQQPQLAMMATGASSSVTSQRRRISARHVLFKIAIAGLLFSTVLFIVGFAAPAWANQTGLWMTCAGGYRYCSNNVGVGPAYLDAVRAMEVLALVVFLVCVGVELYQDVFASPTPPDNKAVEVLAAIAALLGLIGVIIFGAKTGRSFGVYNHYYDQYWRYHIYLQWGFALTAAGCILALVCSALIAYSRVQHKAQTDQAIHAGQGNMIYIPAPPPPSAPAMMPLQSMASHVGGIPGAAPAYQPYTIPYPSPSPYPYFYPCPYPYLTPATSTPLTAPAAMPGPTSPPAAGQDGPSTSQAEFTGGHPSQIPAYYVMAQGRPVPVYSQMPSAATVETTLAATAASSTVAE